MTQGSAQALYAIDPHWFQENQRSFALFVRSRMCPSCRDKAGKKKGAEESNLIARIAACCSAKEGYLSPDLPLLELIFRLFLPRKNQPLSASEISQALKERLAAVGDIRDVSPQTVGRLLDRDQYYGFRRLPQKEGEPAVSNLEAVEKA